MNSYQSEHECAARYSPLTGGSAHRSIQRYEGHRMDNFPRNFRDNLRVSRGTLFVAAVIVAALILGLMAAYSAFDLGSVLPKRGP